MLFTAATLDGLVDGSVTATYRRWTTVRPKVGSRFTTRVGMVEVAGITAVDPAVLSDGDARAAGFVGRDELLRWIERSTSVPRDTRRTTDAADRQPGLLYRIDLALTGPDPRVALRADSNLDAAALADLRTRLDRLDAAADAPWTRSVLRQIRHRPGVVSTELAAEAGWERGYYKTRVRRLKSLGLTESLEIGYRLSPRGEAFLAEEPTGAGRTRAR